MLSPGTRLGTYEVTGHLGSGGMGDVYQARDTTLGRSVAIKVLPEPFAADPERLARFEREAKLLAALNHPNIAAIYGLERSGARRYLVMELVPGETLSDRIAREGPVPVEEALAIARQIAEALAAAHDSEMGIVHRDLKPANVKVTPEGRVKVLDFGLAKAFAGETASANISNSPTLSAMATMQGVIMGTAGYMSPEQARGKQVDKRTDIWAFGCVLYEMLTGRQAFRGEDLTEIIAAIVKSEPDWQALPAETPASIRLLLRRCLEKDKNRRFRDAADVQIQIEETLAAAVATPGAETTVRPPARWKHALPWAAALAASAFTGLVVWTLTPEAPPQPVSYLTVTLPSGEELGGTLGSMVALSSDGSLLAYVGGLEQRIYLRALDALQARPLSGTEGATSPFFSPDGQWIGFFASGKLKKVAVSGGAVLTLSDAPNPRGGAWGSTDTIVFAPSTTGGLSQVSAAGGESLVLTKLEAGENTHRWPEFLPDGRTVLYTVGQEDDASIAAHRLGNAEPKLLIRGGTYARYAATGHLVYYRAGTIMAVPFDAARLDVLGTPAPVLEGVRAGDAGSSAGQFSFSGLGSLTYVPGGPSGARVTMAWVDRRGVVQPLPAPPRAYVNPALSPDGRLVAVEMNNAGRFDVWLYDLMRDTLTRLTFDGTSRFPVWSRDGTRVVYSSRAQGPGSSLGLFWRPADGSGPDERLTMEEFQPTRGSFTPDGRTLAYGKQNQDGSYDLWLIPLEGDRKPRPLLQTPFDERVPVLSPDGRWVAYVSNESGRYEVYAQPLSGPGGKRQISTDGGTEVVWSPKGNELFYRSGAQREKMMAVDVQAQSTFNAGKARLLFEGAFASNVGGALGPDYSVSPDGQLFLMLRPVEDQQAGLTQINVVINWFEELKRRVPTGNR